MNTQSPQTFPPSASPSGTRHLLLLMTSVFLVGNLSGYLLGKSTSPVSYRVPPQASPLTPVSSQTPTVTVFPSVTPSTAASVPYEFLPGFSLNYPPEWSLEAKQFRTPDAKGFIPQYTPVCGERCMGLRLRKSNTSLEMIFQVAFDDNLFRCSNSVEFTPISSDWYRLKDSTGYFYNKNVSLNLRLGESDFIPYGTTSNEWSTIPNTQYRICVQGHGKFLKQRSSVETIEGEGVSILMENPRIQGLPDTEILSQIDQMVVSIKGF